MRLRREGEGEERGRPCHRPDLSQHIHSRPKTLGESGSGLKKHHNEQS